MIWLFLSLSLMVSLQIKKHPTILSLRLRTETDQLYTHVYTGRHFELADKLFGKSVAKRRAACWNVQVLVQEHFAVLVKQKALFSAPSVMSSVAIGSSPACAAGSIFFRDKRLRVRCVMRIGSLAMFNIVSPFMQNSLVVSVFCFWNDFRVKVDVLLLQYMSSDFHEWMNYFTLLAGRASYLGVQRKTTEQCLYAKLAHVGGKLSGEGCEPFLFGDQDWSLHILFYVLRVWNVYQYCSVIYITTK